MTATINRESAEFFPEQDPRFVDYLAQPFAIGDQTPISEAKDIADKPHDLADEEKRLRLQRMIPLMRDPFEQAAEVKTPADPVTEIRALKLEFSNPIAVTPAPAEGEKPIDDHNELFSEF
mgnify:CR=1 FL=1